MKPIGQPDLAALALDDLPTLRALEPLEAARRLSTRPGLAWLDSALADPQAGGEISILTAEPERWFTGNIHDPADWQVIRRARRSLQQGLLLGAVAFNGQFTFGQFPYVLVYHHAGGNWQGSRELAELLQATPTPPPAQRTTPANNFEPVSSESQFLAMVRRAQEYIAAGDIYQVNLSQCFRGSLLPHPLEFYLALRQKSPAPMAAYLDLPGKNQQVLCSSMETFLRMQARQILTKPIKGTRPRGQSPEEDQRLRTELARCEKERAELVMITDLLRNDLGQVCRFGSVQVRQLLEIEAYAQVYHQISRITGILRDEVDHPEALRSCFPGGSITGAPKIRATQIIHELEPLPRGLYTGSIGYFAPDDTACFNIVIRTLINDADAGFSHFHVGAGIVADSQPQQEYHETLHKARGLLETAHAAPPASDHGS